jgi:hypothetical protein
MEIPSCRLTQTVRQRESIALHATRRFVYLLACNSFHYRRYSLSLHSTLITPVHSKPFERGSDNSFHVVERTCNSITKIEILRQNNAFIHYHPIPVTPFHFLSIKQTEWRHVLMWESIPRVHFDNRSRLSTTDVLHETANNLLFNERANGKETLGTVTNPHFCTEYVFSLRFGSAW